MVLNCIFPTSTIEPGKITEQIKKTYNDLSDGPFTAERRIVATILGLVVLGIFGGLSWVALHQSHVSSFYTVAYMVPFIIFSLLFFITVFGGGGVKTLCTALIFPQITVFSTVSGLLLMFGGNTVQSPAGVGMYYGLLVIDFVMVIAMYRSDYRKFPEIAYKNSGQKQSKWWLIVLLCYPLGIVIARSVAYGIIGVGFLMFALYLCHFEAFLLIIARYQPQVAKIMIAREGQRDQEDDG